MKLQRPLCVFDLETTGVQVVSDRIVEMCVIKVEPNGTETTKVWRVNPGMPIPASASAIHGITDDMVANSPSFKELAPEIAAFMKDCDVAGYNSNRFDIPLLAEEMLRAEVDLDLRKVHAVDVQNIFHKKEQRTLSAALKFYCEEELVNAHNAEADVRSHLECSPRPGSSATAIFLRASQGWPNSATCIKPRILPASSPSTRKALSNSPLASTKAKLLPASLKKTLAITAGFRTPTSPCTPRKS